MNYVKKTPEALAKLSYLKVKIKSLAAESRIIKADENKARKWNGKTVEIFEAADGKTAHCIVTKIPGNDWPETRKGLHEHRVNDVRLEARCALLAYAMIRGKHRTLLEAIPKGRNNHYPLPMDGKGRVRRIAKEYGGISPQDVDLWLTSDISLWSERDKV